MLKVSHLSGFNAYQVAAVNPLLDDYAGATAAFGFRLMDSGYAGAAVRIRRSSDDAEADIGFSGNDFDSAAAATHIGGGTGFITTWYDQSGNFRDFVQATSTAQPTYTASGIDGKPCMTFDGTSDYLRAPVLTSALIDNNSGYIVTVINNTSFASGDRLILLDAGNAYYDIQVNLATPSISAVNYDGSADVATVSTGFSFGADIVFEWVHTGGNVIANVNNGTDATTASGNTSVLTTGNQDIAKDTFGVGWWPGLMSEMVFYEGTLPDRAGVKANINGYYNLY
jgi:hypothetical protein